MNASTRISLRSALIVALTVGFGGCSPQEEESGYRYELVGVEQLPDTTIRTPYYVFHPGLFSGKITSVPDPDNLNDFFAYLQSYLILDEAWYEPSTGDCRVSGPGLVIRMKDTGGRTVLNMDRALTPKNGGFSQGLSYCPGKTYRHYKF